MISDISQYTPRLLRRLTGTVLLLFEPIVCFALTAFALLGALITVVLKLEGADARFPFWTMLLISMSFAAASVGYQALVRLVSR
jgi:hypothetical protein